MSFVNRLFHRHKYLPMLDQLIFQYDTLYFSLEGKNRIFQRDKESKRKIVSVTRKIDRVLLSFEIMYLCSPPVNQNVPFCKYLIIYLIISNIFNCRFEASINL